MQGSDRSQSAGHRRPFRWKRAVPFLFILMFLVGVAWPLREALYAHNQVNNSLFVTGTWNNHNYDLVYTVAFSTLQRPDGPLVAYRASAADLSTGVPVVAIQRDTAGQAVASTPVFFPSPDGRYLALLTPLGMTPSTNMSGAALSLYSTDGQTHKILAPRGIAGADQPIWSADDTMLFYHTGSVSVNVEPGVAAKNRSTTTGFEEIHSIDLQGKDTLIWRHAVDDASFQLIGVDKNGQLILSMARANAPVEIVRLSPQAQPAQQPVLVTTLPPDILPGNVLGIGSDGASVNCLRVTQWKPLTTTQIQVAFSGQVSNQLHPLFATGHYGTNVAPLARSRDGVVLVMSQVTALRSDLATQGIQNVPLHENLIVADSSTGASQRLSLPTGGQLIQAFWSPHLAAQQIHAVPANVSPANSSTPQLKQLDSANGSVYQQDEWMLEAHNGLLADNPGFPKMCYATCPNGQTGAPYVSAAILHGVAYTESNWHQFNTSTYQILNEPVGSPIKSFDGGWGEFQQTWGMPPQCQDAGNCRGDVDKVQNDQAYNISVGAATLMGDWNSTAGVVSSTDSNNPAKANHWFFAVWAYNGASGNNPIDVSSDHYGQWYPGASFRSVYEEYVWYFAAHPQAHTNQWTDDYLPSLGTDQLPPQSDFVNTSDSFVRCITCSIPDWTSGSYDWDWVGQGAPNQGVTDAFRQFYNQAGGVNTVGLPIDDGGGAAIHAWGNGLVQNMGGGSFKPGALFLANGSNTVYWVYGGVWNRYKQDQGTGGCHGYPTSNLVAYTPANPGNSDSYYIQNFQHGSIIWDGTSLNVSQDQC